MSTPAVDLRGVRKAYDGATVLDGVDLAIPTGQFVALVGGSGSGKTTLLKLINRLHEADTGGVQVFGEDVRALPAPELRRRIGYVFQEIGLFPHLSVAENVAITLRLQGRPREACAARAAELLALVGLPSDFGARAPAALSGGQRQRVGVARALAAEPRLLLMDEPFGALDPSTRETLGAATRDLHARLGLTTVMVTHDMGEALTLADRIVVLAQGRIVADAAPGELLTAPPDHPAVAALLDPPRRQAGRLRELESAARG